MKIDKSLTILSVILVFLLGVYFIARIYQDDKNKEDINSIIDVYIDKELDYDHFKLYKLSSDYEEGFNVHINDISLIYDGSRLVINNIDILDNIEIVNVIGLYDDLLIMYLKDNEKNYIVKYDTSNNTFELIDSIDNMNVYNIDDMSMFEAGYDVLLSRVSNNGLLIDGVYYNSCDYKDNIVVKKHVVYFYDKASKSFNTNDVVDITYLDDYKKGIC